ncbi:putative serine protease HtrA [Pelotomaculum sp. FP]|uniref:trypsin-like peptidase domain-containing protein n=1 Tax=Pelotomaculum sp. FP TaxID=261474 RepID=UPI0010665A48|nr:trypsin-like peptidase domain-containing protein [Pelotomaculum sp. FP]TEB15082.1 putative serine protease HtrA [Pelotomaculum sp. FP]
MKEFFAHPRVKVLGAFLIAALVVVTVFFAGSWYGFPQVTWPEKAGQASAGTPGTDTIPDIAANTSPAVVRVDTTTVQSSSRSDPFLNDPFFRQFFGDQFRTPSQPQESHGMGSGFIISTDGYILTNEHVISGASSIEVTVSTREKSYPAKLVGSDHDLDLAVLKIEPDGNLPTIALGDSDSIRVGDWAIAIGNPYGLDHTVTVGVISAKGRPITVEDRQYRNLLQTDASINPGNSGGPLLNINGEVIGINTAINAEAQGIGFAIPSNTVKDVYDELVSKGGVTHPWLGVYLQSVTKDIAQYYGLGEQTGAVVASTVSGGPASKAGLQRGDVITQYNGVDITNPNSLTDQVTATPVGSQVEIRFIRDGQTQSVVVTIEAKSSN